MAKRLPSLIVLGLFTVMVVGPTLVVAMEPVEQRPSAAKHGDAVPCPDGNGQVPCDGCCPCLCCPGHAAALLYAPSRASLATPPLATTPRLGLPEAVHPDGVFHRIFRPPRV